MPLAVMFTLAQEPLLEINLLDPRIGNPAPPPVKTAQIRALRQGLHQIGKTVHQSHKMSPPPMSSKRVIRWCPEG